MRHKTKARGLQLKWAEGHWFDCPIEGQHQKKDLFIINTVKYNNSYSLQSKQIIETWNSLCLLLHFYSVTKYYFY